ncbi:rhodanese-like domain-containing protein [Candidatus Odyssella thessalonicensis]|uniref:rhodanese-like domain-containing protein n=1 Tax=Candidatus Odyssella thessalonicensis TaxID=84647 RepID=UPI000225BB18|nr:rhodanese-like domain-containing protein [Candidatus Odyssella thessalonicensis]
MSSVVPTINVQTLDQWLKEENVLLIDVREKHEFNEAAIPGAILMPLSQFQSSDIPHENNRKIVFQCRSGQRSAKACFLFHQDYPEVKAYNLEGGILAWNAAGFSIYSPLAE